MKRKVSCDMGASKMLRNKGNKRVIKEFNNTPSKVKLKGARKRSR